MTQPEVAAKAGRLQNHLLNASRDTANGVYTLPGLMLGMLEDDGWKEMIRPIDGRVFTHSSIEAWVLGEPWGGLNFKTWDMLYVILQRTPNGQEVMKRLHDLGAPVNGLAADTPKIGPAAGPGRGKKKGDNITLLHRGTEATYTIGRLKRDRPDLADQVVRGELSAHAAAIAAGFRNKPVQIAKDPEKAAAAIITARGLTYAKDLAAAIMAWESA